MWYRLKFHDRKDMNIKWFKAESFGHLAIELKSNFNAIYHRDYIVIDFTAVNPYINDVEL